ncbi:DUF1801 domain-containing protein [Massilia soli]|uniref:DUF1801 domain-containing protein n=1 Tax=Massilia soli TaxID=2792854 RepID=A0ABS7SNT5_9BURK|nr:DUF1801 domain-containing protein [Massilia soli]MBZ2207470.1 DUF1801 domain-containing protein [Massilia soli]
MQSAASSVPEYLDSLPEDRRALIDAVRAVILENLDAGYREAMQYGMIGYAVPHSVFPAGYHCDPAQPLPFAALASQKNHVSLYLMGLYVGCTDDKETEEVLWFRQAWADAGKKKLDMGKSCVRFKKLDDIALDVIGQAIRRMPTSRYIERYLAVLAAGSRRPARKA